MWAGSKSWDFLMVWPRFLPILAIFAAFKASVGSILIKVAFFSVARLTRAARASCKAFSAAEESAEVF